MSNIRILRLPNQRGRGWGNVMSRFSNFLRPLFSSVIRSAKPIASRTLRRLGEEGIKEGAQIISDLATGDKEVVKKKLKKGLKRGKEILVDEIENHINSSQTGGKKRKKLQTKRKKKYKKKVRKKSDMIF